MFLKVDNRGEKSIGLGAMMAATSSRNRFPTAIFLYIYLFALGFMVFMFVEQLIGMRLHTDSSLLLRIEYKQQFRMLRTVYRRSVVAKCVLGLLISTT